MTEVITSIDEAIKCLDQAFETASASKASRLTRSERDAILSAIYRVSLSPSDKELLKNHIVNQRKIEGANRSYLMRRSSDYTLMLRYVFPSVDDRSNISRWSGALNQLARIGVPPNSYAQGLKDNGPLMELYWADRDNITRRQKRQTITLSKPIDVVSDKIITLVLRANKQMVFEVIEYRLSDDNFLEAAE